MDTPRHQHSRPALARLREFVGRGHTVAVETPAPDFMGPIVRFLDTLPDVEQVSFAPAMADPVSMAIERAAARLVTFVDDIDRMLDDAQAHADLVVRNAYAEAARIISEAQRQAEQLAVAPISQRYPRAA